MSLTNGDDLTAGLLGMNLKWNYRWIQDLLKFTPVIDET